MMLVLPDVLDAPALAEIQNRLAQARWHDGRETAGYTAREQKNNQQLRADDEVARACGQIVLRALSANPRFVSFALPLRILSPMFNRYQGGQAYGAHIDNAIRVDAATGERIRTDLSCTLFLSAPDSYTGGELVVHGGYGEQAVKLPAGHAVVYPGTSVHCVQPVTHGARLAAFFWIQSMVADAGQRATLFELDETIQALAARPDNAAEVTRLSGTYHNLIRRWAQL